MAEVKSITVDSVKYSIKDATARKGVADNARDISENTENITNLTGRVQALEDANFLPSAKLKFVEELPAQPEEGVYYFIPEEQ